VVNQTEARASKAAKRRPAGTSALGAGADGSLIRIAHEYGPAGFWIVQPGDLPAAGFLHGEGDGQLAAGTIEGLQAFLVGLANQGFPAGGIEFGPGGAGGEDDGQTVLLLVAADAVGEDGARGGQDLDRA